MINILIRTSNRPIFFADCIKSIRSQTYRDINIIVGNDANDCYCKPFNPIKLEKIAKIDHKIDSARFFPYNSYLNVMLKYCKPGYVLILDDDDMLTDSGSLQKIWDVHNEDKTVFWKVKVGNRVVPRKENFQKVVNRDLSMIGMAFSTHWIPLLWFAPYKQADYRLAWLLTGLCDSIWIDEVLTNTQRSEGDGMGLRKDKR